MLIRKIKTFIELLKNLNRLPEIERKLTYLVENSDFSALHRIEKELAFVKTNIDYELPREIDRKLTAWLEVNDITLLREIDRKLTHTAENSDLALSHEINRKLTYLLDHGTNLDDLVFLPEINQKLTDLLERSTKSQVRASSRSSKSDAESASANGIRPLISGHLPAFLSSIAFKGDDLPYTELGPVSQYRGGEVHSEIGGLFSDQEIEECVQRDTFPLPATVDRENYHGDRHFDWWLSGLIDFYKIRAKLKDSGGELSPGDAILDLGCASGRVLRHFAIQGNDLDCWGADINLRNVEWARLFLPENIKVFHSTILPQLPIEDNSLALVTAFSVFTHIDDMEFAWLAEIRRILKPGGFFYVTIHSQGTWASMKAGVPVYDALIAMRDSIHDYDVTEAFLRSPMPNEKTVLSWDTADSYNSNVFHHTDYIVREWGRLFDVVEIIPRFSGYQDVVLLRKSKISSTSEAVRSL
nr:class I SAM-dependent methyltransferase [Rhodoferax sp.]